MHHVHNLFVYEIGFGIVIAGLFYAQWMVKDSMAKDAAVRRMRSERDYGVSE
jgi:hypothetical protein